MEKASWGLVALVGRILIAPLFLASAYGKILNPEGTIHYITTHGMPVPSLAYAVALLVEAVLAVMLILGYKVRLTAGIMALYAVVTALFFHFQLGDHNQFLHFFKNLVIAGGLLQIVAFGGGNYSLDHRFKKTPVGSHI